MNWYRTQKPEPQADGDPRDRTQTSPPEDSSESKTRLEPYPHLDSIAKDEAIFRLKKQYELLEKRVAELEKK